MTPGTDVDRTQEDHTPRTRRILIVDDNREMVHSLKDIVALRGWISDGAESGEDAVRRFRETTYDAVLMDIRMPGMNGVEAFRIMHRDHPVVPVILMTAYTSHQLVDQASSEGVVDVLSKPVSIGTLFGLLEQIEES